MKVTFATMILAAFAASTTLASNEPAPAKRDVSSILNALPRDPSGHGKASLGADNVLRSVDAEGNILGSLQLRSDEVTSFSAKERSVPAPVSRVRRADESSPLLQARDCSHYPCDEDDDCKAYDCHWGCMGDDTFGIGFCI